MGTTSVSVANFIPAHSRYASKKYMLTWNQPGPYYLFHASLVWQAWPKRMPRFRWFSHLPRLHWPCIHWRDQNWGHSYFSSRRDSPSIRCWENRRRWQALKPGWNLFWGHFRQRKSFRKLGWFLRTHMLNYLGLLAQKRFVLSADRQSRVLI